MNDFVKHLLHGRPLWMTGLMVFCAFQVFFMLPSDLLGCWRPLEEDIEVWFGYRLTGWSAKLTNPIHIAIYALGLVGFYKMRRWMHPWAALYAVQVAISLFVWGMNDSVLQPEARAQPAAIVGSFFFLGIAWQLWRSRALFQSAMTTSSE